MAILKFRIYLEEDDSVYRDVAIRHTQSFFLTFTRSSLSHLNSTANTRQPFIGAMTTGSGVGRSAWRNTINHTGRRPC